MALLTTGAFKAGLDELPVAIRKKVPGTLALLRDNPRHPGLQAKPIQCARRPQIYEARVDQAYRLIYERVGDDLYLWRIGPHDVIDEAHKLPAHTDVVVERLRPEGETPPVEPARQQATPLPAARGPFAELPETVLRLFGVPRDRVASVQGLPTVDALFDVPLPSATHETLLDLATRPDDPLASLVDPRRLLYRTTVDQLAGYCEGKIKRLLLNLEPEQRRLVGVGGQGPVMVRGVAGSGKTTIAVYRAHERVRDPAPPPNGRRRRVLMLTFNRTLAGAIDDLSQELFGDRPPELEVGTVDSWIGAYLNRRGARVTLVEERDRRRLLNEALRRTRAEFPRHPVFNRGEAFFASEIAEVLKGRAVPSLDAYRSLVRAGRGSGLLAAHREVVWRVRELYDEGLARLGRVDWADLPLLAWRELERDTAFDGYDDVIVDETQDLTPAKLRVVQRLTRDAGGRGLFLLADAAQSIYYRGIPWSEVGLEIVGRSHRLTRNFRCTRQILTAAGSLLDHNPLLQRSGEVLPPDATDRSGPRPIVALRPTGSDEVRTPARLIAELCERGLYRPGDFAVLAPTAELCEKVRTDLEQHHLLVMHFRDGDFRLLENAVKVCTIHSAKGLEFPVVIVVGADDGVLPLPLQAADDEEAALALEQQRRLMYVAMTRAAERLYLVGCDRYPSPFLKELDPASIQTLASA